MKTALIHWFRFLILLALLSCLMLCSCKSTQPINNIEKHDSIVNKTNTVHFTNVIEKTKAIKDTFAFTFPTINTGATKVQDCDSLCNERVKEALANVSFSKQSGDNGYKIYYDKYKNQLEITAQIGETVNKLKDSIANTVANIQTNHSIIKEIPVNKPLTKTQLFLINSSIIFWILLVAFIGWKIYQTFKPKV